ncbi:phage tail sheath subtilisin-like domain-containing protein [Sphingomonas sp.]|uniref:phage tail sheath subtilisin-like domain-containing protein n=1 Tax=Sphingomonas sp. TaxID=28214 RepID=UPI0028A144C5|nr:phage tail sheath subtilisin-like domain-containing protein [Sphingomonas sp.]
MAFLHGINVSEPLAGTRPILERSTAVIGLVATAASAAGAATVALDAAFPLNRPVLVTDVRTAIGVAGETGTLRPALEAIADQGSPIVIVVRVGVGADAATTSANVLGGMVDGKYTGMQALLAAEAQLGVRPRILGAPGLDTEVVTNKLVTIAKLLRGFAYASCDGITTVGAAVVYAQSFNARELMLIWPDATGWKGKAIATALGRRAMIDEEIGWHKSLSNVPIAGVTGLTADVHFDIRDMSTDAGLLNEGQVTTIVRMNGYRFWGNRTTSDEPLFAFETAVRTSQAIQDAIAETLAAFVDKPMTDGLIRDIEETVNAKLAQWVSEGRLIGGRCWFDSAANPAAQLAAGKLVIDYDYTPVAPLEGLQLNQRITDKYYSGFGDLINAA